MIQENIFQQIVFGIRQLVNGEGGSGRIMDMSVDADNVTNSYFTSCQTAR